MTVLLAVTGMDPAAWKAALEAAAPGRRFVTDRNDARPEEIRYAVAWKHPPGSLRGLPMLKAIFSIGAGVDHLLRDPDLPDAQIVRIVAPDLTARMSVYVLWRVLDHFRQGMLYRARQAESRWEGAEQPAASSLTVGVMGLGELGRDAAMKLRQVGFQVAGWSRTPKHVEGVACFSGEEELGEFLGRADILVSLLPLTPETRGILSLPLFRRLKGKTPLGRAPVLVNAGRGGLQAEADILEALDRGLISEASLDVFEEEPLSPQSPLWRHPAVFVTPHVAADSDRVALAPLIAVQMEAHDRGEPLRHVVDRQAGY